MYCLRVVTIFCIIQTISAYCHIGIYDTAECTAPNGDTIPVGATLEIQDKCERCSCMSSGDSTSLHMQCCGYGIHAGVMMPPPGCKIITGEDGCSPVIVKVDDETKLC